MKPQKYTPVSIIIALAIVSNIAYCCVNQLPEAVMWPRNMETIEVFTPITFDGQSSYDPDGGSIVQYHWQYQKGTYYENYYINAPTTTKEFTFNTPGECSIRLWVKDNEGTWSDEDQFPYFDWCHLDIKPQEPENLEAEAGDGTVTLTWTYPTPSHIAYYRVYRHTSSPVPTTEEYRIADFVYDDENAEYIDDDGLVNGMTYYYVVTDVKAGQESHASNTASAMPVDSEAPAAPTGLVLTLGERHGIELNWNDNTDQDIARYNVYRSEDTGGPPYDLIKAGLVSSDYIDDDIIAGTEYFYVVAAVDTSMNVSDYSSEVFIVTVDQQADNDKDYMTDYWETRNGLNPELFDAYQDNDGDGYANVLEYEFYSKPSDFSSTPSSVQDFNVIIVRPDSTANVIQQAIDNSSENDVIVAMPGTYSHPQDMIEIFPADTSYYANFVIDNDRLSGIANLTLRSLNPLDPDIIDSTILTSLVDDGPLGEIYGDTSIRVLYIEDINAVISGFTITGGDTAIRCESTSPTTYICTQTISNCIITKNSNTHYPPIKNPPDIIDSGPGIYAINSIIRANDCVFRDNEQINIRGIGGVICLDNSGISSFNISCSEGSVFDSCVFANNASRMNGGVIYSNSRVKFNASVFSNNYSYDAGGAIYFDGSPTYDVLTVNNCTFHKNVSEYCGGAIYFNDGLACDLYNDIFWENEAKASTNPGHDIYGYGDVTINHSCTIEEDDSGNGDYIYIPYGSLIFSENTNQNPLFVNTDEPAGIDGVFLTEDDGLQLQQLSSCVDAGLWETEIELHYCNATSGNGYYGHIVNVEIEGDSGNIDKDSGDEIYEDYTAQQVQMTVLNNYQLEVTSGWLFTSDECGMWVDWNQDGYFDDNEESIYVYGSPGTGPYTATIIPPATSINGETRVRIRMTNGETPSPCSSQPYGDVEDYTIVVVGGVEPEIDTEKGDILGNEPVDIPFVTNNGSGDEAYADIGAYERTTAVIHVNANASSSGNGHSWDEAYQYLQDALAEADGSEYDDVDTEIWVAQGTYYPDIDASSAPTNGTNLRTDTFTLVSNVALYGSFKGDETCRGQRDYDKYETILSGDIDQNGQLTNNSYHVVTGANNAILDGFIITSGNADGEPVSAENRGGGIYNSATSPIIRNCMVKGNSAKFGGGILNDNDSLPILYNCTFSQNSAIYFGGGIYNNYSDAIINNCIFKYNSAHNGGGLANNFSSPVISNSAFLENTASGEGGAVKNDWESGPKFNNCLFYDNSAEANGGAINNMNLQPITFINCTVTANSAGNKGGGMYNDGAINITNCIFWNNEADTGGNEIYNSTGCEPQILSSDIQGCRFSGENWDTSLGTDKGGNIDIDPYFVNVDDPIGPDGKWFTEDDGLRLKVIGPDGENIYDYSEGRIVNFCIDGGNSSAAPDKDITGRSRVDVPYIPNNQDKPTEFVDMGAYEMPVIWYVNIYSPIPGIGSCWEYALEDLQQAIAKAKDGEEIWVARGTYKPGNEREDTFNLNKNIKLYGGFNGTEYVRYERDSKKNETILSGDIKEADTYSDNSYHIVTIDSADIILDGFTIREGFNNSYFAGDGGMDGAGIYMNDSSSIVTNCEFRFNCADDKGSCIYVYGGKPIIKDCRFVDNYCKQGNNAGLFYSGFIRAQYGGAIHLQSCEAVIADCFFARNAANYGGAVSCQDSNLNITKCVFQLNSASNRGGAVYYGDEAVLKRCFIDGCLFAGNYAESTSYGGGITLDDCYMQAPQLFLTNCTFTYNSNRYDCKIDENGTAMFIDDGWFVRIINCNIWKNKVLFQNENTEIGHSNVEDCIDDSNGFWNPRFGGIACYAADLGGNIDEDPLFIDDKVKFSDLAIMERFWGQSVEDYARASILLVEDASIYEVGDIIEYDDSFNIARTVVDVDYQTNELTVCPPYLENTMIKTEGGVNVTIWDSMGFPKTPPTDTTYSDGGINYIRVVDGDHFGYYDLYDLIEYNNDGVIRQVTRKWSVRIGVNSFAYYVGFSPSLIDSYRKDVEIKNWGKYAINRHYMETQSAPVEMKCLHKSARLKVTASQATSSPCIDTGIDKGVAKDRADLDEDGLTSMEYCPYDIMGVPRIQEIFDDADPNSVDMGAFETGGLRSSGESITTQEDTPVPPTPTPPWELDIEDDPKGGDVSYIIVKEPIHGTLQTTSTKEITYTPELDYFDTSGNADYFYYRPFDGINTGESSKVTITQIAPVDDAPTAVDDAAWYNQGSTEDIYIEVINNDEDVEDENKDLFVGSIGQDSSFGTESIESDNRTIKYHLDNANGLETQGYDSFTYYCQDTGNNTDTSTVTVYLNYKPVAVADSYTTELGIMAAIDVTVNDTDDNTGQELYAGEITTQPTYGQTVIYKDNPKYILYMPDSGQESGYNDSFSYKVMDENGLLSDAAVTVSITVDDTENIQDSDEDGISDEDEKEVFGTDAFKSDTDGDGVYDSVELFEQYNPLNKYESGYYADDLPYTTCFQKNQNYTINNTLDGQLGWEVEQGNCILDYMGINPGEFEFGCICACIQKGGSVISKEFNDKGTEDDNSNFVVVKLYPSNGAWIKIYSDGIPITGVRFVENAGASPDDGYVEYWSQGGWHQSNNVTWNYDWADYFGEPYNPDNPYFPPYAYSPTNYGLVVRFEFDFTQTSEQCDVKWSSYPDNVNLTWSDVGTSSFNSTIKHMDKIKFVSGDDYGFRVRGLYINEGYSAGCGITFPKRYDILQSRIPIKGWCCQPYMSGYKIYAWSDDTGQYFIVDEKNSMTNPVIGEGAEQNVLGYWNTGMFSNGRYAIDLRILDDTCYAGSLAPRCRPDEVSESTLEQMFGIDYDSVCRLTNTGSVKNSNFHYVEEPDISVPWPGEFPFEFRRTYDSSRCFIDQGFYPGWTNNLQIILTEYADYYESSTCEDKVGGETADQDASGLAFGAIYVQYEDGSMHLFRHTTGSTDSVDDQGRAITVYTPYPDDGSGAYIIRAVEGQVSEFRGYCGNYSTYTVGGIPIGCDTEEPVVDCYNCVGDGECGAHYYPSFDPAGDGYTDLKIYYKLLRADGTIIEFNPIDQPDDEPLAVTHPDGTWWELDCDGGNVSVKEYYYPFGGAVYKDHSGSCGIDEGCYWGDLWRWHCYEGEGEDCGPSGNPKWRFVTAVKTKTDRFGNTLVYEWNENTNNPAVNKATYDPGNGLPISIEIGPTSDGYAASLKVNDTLKRKFSCTGIWYSAGIDTKYLETYIEAGDETGKYKSYAYYTYNSGECTGLLEGIFSGKLLPDGDYKIWDWTKRKTIVWYDYGNNYVKRADFDETAKDNYTTENGNYLPFTEGDIFEFQDIWWFFYEPDSGNDEDGQCVLQSVDHYKTYDYLPYLSEVTIVNEKGQLRHQIPGSFFGYDTLSKFTSYEYGNMELPFTPTEIREIWHDFNSVDNIFVERGRRSHNNYENNKTLEFDFADEGGEPDAGQPIVERYDLVSQSTFEYDTDNFIDLGLLAYSEKEYHDYAGYKFDTNSTSYQELDKEEPYDSHQKPTRTELIYAKRLTDGTYQVEGAPPEDRIYLIQEITLLDDKGTTNTEDDDTRTVEYYYDHRTSNGPDETVGTEDDAYALTMKVNCGGGGVTFYEYDNNHHLTWQKIGASELIEEASPVERYLYDELGQLILKADTYGLVTRNQYDGFGNVIEVYDYHDPIALDVAQRPVFDLTIYDDTPPTGVEIRSRTFYTYDENNRKQSERTVSYEKKVEQNLPYDEVKTAGTFTNYAINNQPNCVTVGVIYENGSDELIVEPQSKTEYFYDGTGLKISEKTTDLTTGLWWYGDYFYDSLGRLKGSVLNDYEDRDILKATAQQHNGSGQQNYEKLFGYDADGAWKCQKRVDYWYDLLDRKTEQILSTKLDRNNFHQPVEYTKTIFGYDDVGNQTWLKDPKGKYIFSDYDNANRRTKEYFAEACDTDLATTKNNAQRRKEYSYDDNDRVTDITSYDYDDDILAYKEFYYDERGRLEQVQEAIDGTWPSYNFAVTGYAYYDAKEGTTVDSKKYAYATISDAESKVTEIVYSERGDNLKITFPSDDYQQVRYNGDGTPDEQLVFDSSDTAQWIEYHYDDIGRLYQVEYPDTPTPGTLTYSYDGLGRQTQVIDDRNSLDNIGGRFSEMSFQYDPFGQLIGYTEQDGYQVSYSYAADGQKQSIVITEPFKPDSILYKVNYYFDPSGRLTEVNEPELAWGYQNVAGFEYDDNGNRSKLKYYLDSTEDGDISYIDYSYNADNLLSGFTTTGGPTYKLENVIVDGLGRLTDADETLTKTDNINTSAHTLDFGYDMLSQLKTASISNINPAAWTGSYVYNKNGDIYSRTTTDIPTETAFIFTGNQMASATGGEAFSLGYDENGNLKLINDSTDTDITWNWDNKLRSASKGTKEMAVRYDPMGNRNYKSSTVDSVTTERKYIVDIAGDLPVILLELNASEGSVFSVAKSYIYANSEILAQYDGDWRTPLDCKSFYLHDRLGSVRQIIDCQAEVVKLYTYNPFGELIEEEGTFDNPFRFTGQYYDSEISQYYLRARQYDPHLYRFISRDFIMGDFGQPLTLHRYLYCINDPINRIDPQGLWTFYITGTGMASFAWSGVRQSGLVIDDDGNVGWINITGIGAGTPAASIGTSFGWTNADTIFDLEGVGGSMGGAALILGADYIFGRQRSGDFYHGFDVTFGKTLSPAYGIEVHTHITKTEIMPSGLNWREAISKMKQTHEDSLWEIGSVCDYYKWAYIYGILDNVPDVQQ